MSENVEDLKKRIEDLERQNAEHQENARAYERILGQRSYQEVADELVELRADSERLTAFENGLFWKVEWWASGKGAGQGNWRFRMKPFESLRAAIDAAMGKRQERKAA